MRLKAIVSLLLVAFLSGNLTYADVMPMYENTPPQNAQAQAPLVERYLLDGNLSEGESALSAQLQAHQLDDQARFGLGMLRFLRTVERLGQDLYRYGFRLPVVNSPIPLNPNPEVLTYAKSRGIIETFVRGLSKVEVTLAPIKDEKVSLPLHFGLIKLDLLGNGAPGENQSLWRLYRLYNQRNFTPEQAKNFYIKFDKADVHWLRGYCHLIKAFCEIWLAYDFHESFDCSAGVFFQKTDSPYAILRKNEQDEGRRSLATAFDLVALIHTIRWPLVEPALMRDALADLQAGIAQDKEMWRSCMQETGDDHEWIPNPRQTGVIPGMKVTDAMVESWINMLDELEKLLQGKTLVPFWRGDKTLGINVHRVFTEPPRNLDLVMWVQGSAAIPYLERGTLSAPQQWLALANTFGAELPGFALWFN
jgi:hypothetical protein